MGLAWLAWLFLVFQTVNSSVTWRRLSKTAGWTEGFPKAAVVEPNRLGGRWTWPGAVSTWNGWFWSQTLLLVNPGTCRWCLFCGSVNPQLLPPRWAPKLSRFLCSSCWKRLLPRQERDWRLSRCRRCGVQRRMSPMLLLISKLSEMISTAVCTWQTKHFRRKDRQIYL